LAITSPLVGIFHPAVQAGQQVQTGQSIGAIEALGMPTSVDAPQSGTVEDLLVQDGSPVEYGQPLLILRRGDAS
jgi:biotin carboxyl carrier protein